MPAVAPSALPAPSLRPRHPAGVTLCEVADSAGVAQGWAADAVADLRITGITLRAQDVRPGDLFAALPGSRVHGSRYAAEAVRAGAAAVLTDPAGAAAIDDTLGRSADGDNGRQSRPGPDPKPDRTPESTPVLVVDHPRAVLGSVAARIYGDPSRHLGVVGVTGTAGKTTTCYLLEAALAADGSTTGLIGTVETRIDGEVAPSALTTPEAPDLQALFAVMVERGVRVVAMEVSSHSLSMGRVAGTSYAVGAFSNLSQDHLDFHHDMEDYFAAKSMLFDGRAARHVIMIDDVWGRRLAADHPDALTVSSTDQSTDQSTDRPADWSVLGVEQRSGGVQQVTLQGPGARQVTLDLALPGVFNVANAALALACVDALGRDVGQAAKAMAGIAVPGRMERVSAGQDYLAVVDYAHKPAALAAVLDAISEGLTGRLIVVIGAGGARDPGKRPMMGAETAGRADLVIVTDDNPRSEDPAEIRRQVLDGARGVAGTRPVQILEIGDRRAAIRAAVAAARRGDAVVIAGKGHEQGQDVGGVIHPFSDRLELTDAITAALRADPGADQTADETDATAVRGGAARVSGVRGSDARGSAARDSGVRDSGGPAAGQDAGA